MSDPASQKNSPYIVLALLSVLVVSTLVVASMYFVGPNIKTYSEDSVTTKDTVTKEVNKTKVSVVNTTQITKPKETMPNKVIKAISNEPPKKESDLLAAKIEPPVEKDLKIERTVKADPKPKDDCEIQFTGNQLLVKNSKQ